MARTNLANLDKKLDVVVAEIGFIREGQNQLAKTLEDHTKSDQTHFDELAHTHHLMSTDLALLKKSDSQKEVSFNVRWSHIATVVGAVLVAVILALLKLK